MARALDRRRALAARLPIALFAFLVALSARVGPGVYAQAEDWAIERSEERRPARSGGARAPVKRARDAGSIERYVGLSLARPADEAVFERLVALARSRDGSLEPLLAQLAEPDKEPARAAARWLLLSRLRLSVGDAEGARQAAAQAIERSPKLVAALVHAAALDRGVGQLEGARDLLERAQAAASREDRRAILLDLADLELERGDYDAASRAFTRSAAGEPASPFSVTAYARALAARDEHTRAADEYRAALSRLKGDERAALPVRIEQARCELAAGEVDAALATLQRALALAGSMPGLRYAALELLAAAHRHAGSLPELVAELQGRSARSAQESALLAQLHEELGDIAAAERELRRVLASKPRATAERRSLVRLLNAQGRIDEALREHQRLVDAAPSEPALVIGLAQTLLESGQRDAALELLARTATRFATDARMARALLDLYTRWGERDRAQAMLERLARIEPSEPSHALALGQDMLSRGDEAGARRAFARALDRASDPARAQASLGELYLDVDKPEQALAHFEKAVRLAPEDTRALRGLAEALERVRRPAEAEAAWRRVMALSSHDRAARREARRRIVLLWAATSSLRAKLRELEMAFGMRPPERAGSTEPLAPDPEAGRFLVEAYRALATSGRRARADSSMLDAADAALTRLLQLEPGDVEGLMSLERLRASRNDLGGASDVLERLLKADPAHAATYLARLAEHAQLQYRDDDALAYAQRLAAIAPDDSQAHRRLARLYRERQDRAAAGRSLMRALELDAQAYDVALELAELSLAQGELTRADTLLRRVISNSSDDELVRRAGRSLLQLHATSTTLAALEPYALQLAQRSDRKVHRELLLELYAQLTPPLLAEDSDHARARLAALGQAALKPLLEALSSPDASARQLAVALLGATRNPAVRLPLLGVAEREGDLALRRSALVSLGPLIDANSIPRVLALARSSELRVRDAAAWALACAALGSPAVRSRSLERALLGLVESEAPTVRGYALIGLTAFATEPGLLRAQSLLEHDRSSLVRGAAALLLGVRGQPEHAPRLLAALAVDHETVASAAAFGLGWMGASAALDALAVRVFEPDPRASYWSAWALARPVGAARLVTRFELPPPGDAARLEPTLHAYRIALAEPSARLSGPIQAALERALLAALSGSPRSARRALEALDRTSPRLPGIDSQLQRALVYAVVSRLRDLAAGREPHLRELSLRLLAQLDPETAAPAIAQALSPSEPSAALAALDTLIERGTEGAVLAARAECLLHIAEIARASDDWTLRQKAVQVLGRAHAHAPANAEALEALLRALASDTSAYVRHAAAEALSIPAALESARAEQRRALQRAVARDIEARVRAAAASALDLSFR